MTCHQSRLAAWAEFGLRLGISPAGRLTYRIPAALPTEDVLALLRDRRDDILIFLRDLDDSLASALEILRRLEAVPGMTADDRGVVREYRRLVVGKAERLDPFCCGAGEWAVGYLESAGLPVPRGFLDGCHDREGAR